MPGRSSFPSTTVRWDFDYQYMEHNGEGNCFLGPDGRLFTAAGRTEVNMPPDDVVDYESDRYAAHVLTKLSQNWESKFQASVWNYWGPMDNGIVLLSAVNYANQMLTFLPAWTRSSWTSGTSRMISTAIIAFWD